MDLTKPVLLVDVSSYIFYRAFAINSWSTHLANPLTTEEFITKYKKLFYSKLYEYCKTFHVPYFNVVLAQDCPRSEIWRMDLFPEYKKNRSRPQKIDPAVFTVTYNTLIPNLKERGMHSVSYPRAEADDIIAVFHGALRKESSNLLIYIMTCDMDLLQLIDNYTHVLNFQMKSLVKLHVQPYMDVFVKWKVIMGDDSDNIPAIDAKIGKITANKLARCAESLSKRLKSSLKVAENYERNDKLINLQRIPIDIKNGIESVLKSLKAKKLM